MTLIITLVLWPQEAMRRPKALLILLHYYYSLLNLEAKLDIFSLLISLEYCPGRLMPARALCSAMKFLYQNAESLRVLLRVS